VTDAAIHCMQSTRSDNAVRSMFHSGSPRAFSPRDDKPRSVKYHSNSSSLAPPPCHCEERTKVTDAAIHCMQWTRTDYSLYDLSLRFPVHSGSPRTFSPRDDKGGKYPIPIKHLLTHSTPVSLRGGNQSDRRGNPLHAMDAFG
jgi:hypothetical protein